MTSSIYSKRASSRSALLKLAIGLILSGLGVLSFTVYGRTEMVLSVFAGISLVMLGLFLSQQMHHTLISPFTFYLIPWGLVLILHAFFLSDFYLAPLLPVTYLAVLVGIAGFLFGAFLAKRRSTDQGFGDFAVETKGLSDWDLRQMNVVISVLFALGFIAAIYQLIMIGGPLELISNPQMARFNFWRTESGYFFGMLANAVIFAAYYQIRIGRLSISYLLASILAIILLLLPGSRTLAFFALGQVIILWLMQRRQVDTRSVILVLVLFLVFIIVNDYRDQGRSTGLALIERGLIQLDTRLNWLVNPYLYLTTPLQNLQQNLLYQPEYTMGARLFYPLIAALQLDSFFDYGIRLYSGSYNVGTYLVDFYQDFGWVGIVMGSTLLGYLSTASFLQSSAPVHLLLAAMYLYVLAISIFSNYLNDTNVWISIALVYTLGYLCETKNKNSCRDCSRKYGVNPQVTSDI